VARVSRIDTDIDDAYVRCRSYSHAWDEYFPIDLDPPVYGWRLSLRCTRCATERHDNLGFNGQLLNRRYIYPEGYSTRGITRTQFREALYVKLRAKLEASAAIGADSPIPKRRRKAAV